MEKESNFRETWKMRIWMFLKMVNWICKKYCGFVAATGCVFGTIVLYVLATEASVQISIAQKDYEMLLPGTFTIGAAIYILFMTGYREICCRNKFSVEVLWSSIFVTLMANKIGGLQFGIYRNCQISSRVFHTAVAALPLTKANRSDFE